MRSSAEEGKIFNNRPNEHFECITIHSFVSEEAQFRNFRKIEPPGGYMTCGWTGVCRPVFRKVPSSNYRNLRSYPL